jgi:DNA repair exonuclease SbcCD ATPase subunit
MSIETEEAVIEEVPAPELEAEQPEQEAAAPAPEEPEEVIVTIGDEQPAEEEEQPSKNWVNELRKKNREDQKRIRELEAKLQQTQPQQAVPRLGPKPTLEGMDYDSAKYEAALEQWYGQKRQVDEFQSKVKQAEQQQMQAWQSKLEAYGSAKQALRVRDYEDAEATVQEALNTVQQGVLLQGADNPAMVVYALGKNPKKAKELASITDPVKFAFAVAKLEAQLKVAPRKTPPRPKARFAAPHRSAALWTATLTACVLKPSAQGTIPRSTATSSNSRQRPLTYCTWRRM